MPEKLSEEKVLELLQRIKGNDSQARDDLIVAFAGLPYQIARKHFWEWCNSILYDELITVGYMALIELVVSGKFDPGKGMKFKTFAYSRIKSRMNDQLRKRRMEIYAQHESLDGQHEEDEGRQVKEIVASGSNPEQASLVRELLSRAMREELSDQECRAITLCEISGLSLEEAAKELGIKVVTLEGHLSRARQKLAKSPLLAIFAINFGREVKQNA